MEITGYIASILIGVTLGLIGAGGSILTVPVLVFLFAVDAVSATAYSLFIVGVTSAVGSVRYFQKGLVNVKTAIIFGIPSVISVFLTRAYVVPFIPDSIGNIGSFEITKGFLIMFLFALVMIFASYSMIKKAKVQDQIIDAKIQNFNYPLIVAQGVFVGMLAGLVGAGGGFLIIPALVRMGKLQIKEAIGTSLLIIAFNSFIGFFGENSGHLIDWILILSVTAFAIIGIFIGMALSKKVDGAKLKPAFGWFILIMGFYIILQQTLLS